MLALDPINEALKSRGVKGRIVPAKDRLFLRGTFTAADGTRKDRRIPLGLPAHNGQLLEAENRVIALAGIIATTGIIPDVLPWDDAPAPTFNTADLSVEITVATAVERLEEDYWQGKVRSSAAIRTWDRLKAETDRLPQRATITMDLLVAVASRTTAGSRTRLESCKVLKRLAKLVGLAGTERLDALRTPYEPGERTLPSDDELKSFLTHLEAGSEWQWCFWALATYGCRPAEVFSLQPSDDGTARVLSVKRKGKLPTWRTAMALPVGSMQLQRSVPWDVAAPARYDSLEAKRHCDRWQGWLKRRNPGWQLYDFRHCWAVRSIREAVPTGLASRCMGHDIAVHTRTYHRWLTEADVAAFVASRKN